MNRLKAFDKEFNNLKELNEIVTKLNYSLNYEEKSQGTNEIPNILFQKEKERLISKISMIPLYEKGKGFPIGNMTSQIIAILYLNELDHYIKEKLGIKYYVRYMDDGILIHEDKNYLMYCLGEIKNILKKYKLVLNMKKTEINSIKKDLK